MENMLILICFIVTSINVLKVKIIVEIIKM